MWHFIGGLLHGSSHLLKLYWIKRENGILSKMTIMTFYNILYNYPTFKFCCLKLWPGSRTASWLTSPGLAAILTNTNGNISSRKIKSRKMKFATKINILFSGRGNQLCPVYWIISRPFSNYNKIWHLTFVFKINENWRHTFSKARPLHRSIE